jgi:two-component sensor histidine kinase
MNLNKNSRRTESLVIVDEITHRVVNEYTQAIAAIRLAAAETVDDAARLTLAAAAKTLRAYADAHRALQSPMPDQRIELGSYLERLCEALLCAGLRDKGIHLKLVLDPVELSSGRAWRVGLIVSELITNAMRHGFGGAGGSIFIDCALSGPDVRVRVIDNGRPAVTPRLARGSAVVEGLAADLGGHINWCFRPSGTTAACSFPRVAPAETGPGSSAWIG